MPDVALADGVPAAPRSAGRTAWTRFRRHRLAVVGTVVLAALCLAVAAGPELLPYDAQRIDLAVKDQAPTLAHPMGTDDLGRDQLTRVLVGGRLTLAVAVAAVLVAMVVGVAVGLVAGSVGGRVDALLMRLVDVFYSLPALFLVIMLVALRGPGFQSIVLTIAAVSWMNTARLVRAATLSLKEREFVQAARAGGVGELRIAVRHVLPNAMSPVIVSATLGIAIAILIESALSFLGLGFNPPRATWGGMLQESQRAVITAGHWWRGLFPGLMIFVCVLSVSYVGDALRDALDPRARRR